MRLVLPRRTAVRLLVGLALLVFAASMPFLVRASAGVAISGRLIDGQGEGIPAADVALLLNGQLEASVEVETDAEGVYLLDLPAEPYSKVELTFSQPHFAPGSWEASAEELAFLNQGASIRVPDIELQRRLTPAFWIAAAIFVGMLALVITERLHTTAAALLGAAVLLAISLVGGGFSDGLYIIDLETAVEYVDFEVIFLVLGMMIIVGTIERTGIFQWTAYQAYRVSGGRMWLLAVILMLITSVASALLDNVTTMLLMAPITLQIALALGANPLALLIPEMLASNVGGISTLIGTPNNILIGSYAGLGFTDFLRNLTPGVLLVQVALTFYVLWVFRKAYRNSGDSDSQALLAILKENARITQPGVLRRAGLVFLGTLVLFVVGEGIHMEPAVTAMLGAAATLLVVRADIEEILRLVDWTTLLFFIALFMVIGALQEVGMMSLIATGIHVLVADNLLAATLVVIWGSAMFCLLIPTIPLTAALLPVVGFLSRTIPGAGSDVLYYSLSMGSALGANNSLIGATNNMVTAGISQRAGFPITFRSFIRIGFPAVIVSLVVGTLWILFRF